jgi:two-component system, NtrC family, sensor kinase
MRGRLDPIVLAAGAVLGTLLVVCGAQSLRWLDRPFAGFLLLENRVVASAGLGHWPAVRDGEIYQQEVVAVDGRPLGDARELASRVESLPVGTELRYRLRRDGIEQERIVATARFTARDFGQLFGSLFFCGVALCGMAIAIRFLRGNDSVANGTATSLGIVGLWSLTATDLYGPYHLFRVHAASECLLAAALLHMALVFPAPARLLVRWPTLPYFGYALAGGLALVNQAVLYDPHWYGVTHRLAVTGFGVGLAALIGTQAWSWMRPQSFAARQRVKVVALGAVFALSPMLVLVVSATLTGGQAPENAMAFTGILYPLSIGYAVMRADLLEVDAFVRRSLNYVVMTGVLAIGYAALLAGMEGFAGDVRGPGFALVYSLAAVLLVIPLRDRMQSAIDRVFFRSAYDFRRLVSRTSERLASVIDRDVIAVEVGAVVEGALRPATIAFEARRVGEAELDLDALAAPLDPATRAALARDRSHLPIETADGGLVVPFVLEERRVAVLVLGRRLSGAFYGGDDRRLLQTLANQGAVALENALALEELRELNQTLEQKVVQRTHELASTLEELRNTQSQLLHQEKMASLGQLVAGIAHELNNPLNFVEGNLDHLREYLDTLTRALAEIEQLARDADAGNAERLAALREQHDLDYVLGDIGALFAAMDEGVDRATAIIRELRTFSRLDKNETSEVDVHQSLDATLNLMRGRLAGVEIVRAYGSLPLVECLEGPLAQVFMNLVANAADAVAGAGRITLRTETVDECVAIEIEDTGAGIAEDALEKIFEPFYTTKPVGSGTGLGLAISYGIVTRHQGRIRVKSRRGAGACFRVEIPLRFRGGGSTETIG